MSYVYLMVEIITNAVFSLLEGDSLKNATGLVILPKMNIIQLFELGFITIEIFRILQLQRTLRFIF